MKAYRLTILFALMSIGIGAAAEEPIANQYGRPYAYPRSLDDAAPVASLIAGSAGTKLVKSLPLLFEAQVDDRPYVVERCLYWAAVEVNETNQWWLIGFHRSPYGPLLTHQQWTISSTAGVHSPLTRQVYGGSPTNDDVEAFLRWANWDLSPGKGFQFITTRMFSSNWVAAIGERPRVSYKSRAEPDGPADGSQPIRSGTNTTSSAARSRR